MENPKPYMVIDDDVVVPHGCIELIIEANYTQNITTFFLAGIHDTPFNAKRHINNDVISRISIRFFFWAYHLFVNTDMYVINTGILDDLCFDREWLRTLSEIMLLPTIEQRIQDIERFLISKLFMQRINANLYNSVYYIVSSQGALDIADAVDKYGFADQSHLLNNFRKYHGTYPIEAKQNALNVDFFQYSIVNP